jgi:hypothetical protein
MYLCRHQRWREVPDSEVAREPTGSERVPEERALSYGTGEMIVHGRRRRWLAGKERKREEKKVLVAGRRKK